MRPDFQFPFVRRELVKRFRRLESGRNRLSSRDLDGFVLGDLALCGGSLCLWVEEGGDGWWFEASFSCLFDFLFVVQHLVVELVRVHLDAFFSVCVPVECGGVS